MERMPRHIMADSTRPLGEKLRTLVTTEILEKPKLKDARILGDKLRRANPTTANKPKTTDHDKIEIAQLDLVKILKSLGTNVKGKYVKDPICLLALKHMARHIRDDRNNEKLTVRLHLVGAGVIKTNLIPLMLDTPDDDKLWQLCLNAMYDLTIPPAVIIKAIPKDRVEDSQCLKMYLREYDDKRQASKKLFVDPKFFHLLCDQLKKVLTTEERDRDQTNFVGNALRLLRNIFEMRGEVDGGLDRETPATIHDKVFSALDQSRITAILLWLASSEDEEDFVLDILEVVYALLRDFDPEALGKAEKTDKDIQDDQAVIRKMREREEAVRKANAMKAASRHSSFGGSFTVKGSRAVDPNNEIVILKPVSSFLNKKFELTASKQAKARNKRVMRTEVERTVAPAVVSSALRNFCLQFIQKGYNTFMRNAKLAISCLPAEDTDDHYTRYFWALRFFTAFSRVHKVGVEFISETVSMESFHFIHSKIENYTDSLITDKPQISLWSNRSHIALRAYQELLMTLAVMMGSTEPNVSRAAKQIESNLFYLPEYREIFFKLLQEFSEAKYSRAYLKDLIVTIHIFLKLLEVYLKSQTEFFVMKKQKSKKGPKKLTTSKATRAVKISSDARAKIWDAQKEELRSILEDPNNAGMEESCVPFDSASTADEEEQKNVARTRIQVALLEKESFRAVALLKASKKVWPYGDLPFGTVGDKTEDDLKILQKIILEILSDLLTEDIPPVMETSDLIDDDYDGNEEGKMPIGEEVSPESDSKKTSAERKEVHFELESFLKRFATPSHIEPYFVLLKEYARNSSEVNHAVLKMLHRIAVDLMLPGMLFQISLFRLYQRLLKEENPVGDPRFHAELRKFMQFILQKFFEKMREDPAFILSVLFWKTRSEAHDLVEGPVEKPKKKSRKSGTEGVQDLAEDGITREHFRQRDESSDEEGDAFVKLRRLAVDQREQSTTRDPDRRESSPDPDRLGLVPDPDRLGLISKKAKKNSEKKRNFSKKRQEANGDPAGSSSSSDQELDIDRTRKNSTPEQDEDVFRRLRELSVEARKRVEKTRKNPEKAIGKRRVVRPVSDDEDENELSAAVGEYSGIFAAILSPPTSVGSKENTEDLMGDFGKIFVADGGRDLDSPIRGSAAKSKKRLFEDDDDDQSNNAPALSPPPGAKKSRLGVVSDDSDESDEESNKRPKLVIDDEF